MNGSDRVRAGPGRWALVALGANLGDAVRAVTSALERLEALSEGPLVRSSLWQSTPVDCPPGSPLFINAAAKLMPSAGESPETLLVKLQAIEREFGRQPKRTRNEARPLDLDLIAFGFEVRQHPALTLPHPRAHLRRFVLEPLAEIARDVILPGQTLAIGELLVGLPPDPLLRRVC